MLHRYRTVNDFLLKYLHNIRINNKVSYYTWEKLQIKREKKIARIHLRFHRRNRKDSMSEIRN